MEVLHLIIYTIIGAFSLVYLLLRKRFTYWADSGVVHEKPVLFYGNLKEVGRTQPLRKPLRDFYMKYRNSAPFGGFYFYMRHAVVLFDLELIKTVLIKDFNNFSSRGVFYNEKDDPLSGHLFNLDGPKWRKLRHKLTPTFTSGKMKFMYPTVVEVAQRFTQVLENLMLEAAQQEQQPSATTLEFSVEIKDLLARFTTDVIGTCAFGLECNSLRDPNTQFRIMGKKIFAGRRFGKFGQTLIQAFPNIARKLHIKNYAPDISEFFMRVVRETVEYREREHVERNDFMNMLIELKNNNDVDSLTLEELAAQAFVFFLAGFETSSSTMSFALYEMAIKPQIQEKARAEIFAMLQRYEGKFTYEGMRELKYLQQIFNETLRVYSIATQLHRITVNDYKVPNTDHIIKAGTLVIVPIDAIHKDPDIYADSETFNPDNFAPEEIAKRHSMSWLPFGEGPRNCIGLRFGEMQALIGLAMLLKNFKFSPALETPIPLKIKVTGFVLESEGGTVLKVEKL